MLWRFLYFIVLQIIVGIVLGQIAGYWGALIGVVVCSWIWLFSTLWCAGRLIKWLRQDGDAPKLFGYWSEISIRIQKILRKSELNAIKSDDKLQLILTALQASPNGVVLLDSRGYIDWFNQAAAQHFGFDIERDLRQSFCNLVRDPLFFEYYTHGNYEKEIIINARNYSEAKPVIISVRLYNYEAGRKLLLALDVTAIKQADAMRRDFVANVSHEIRTPLTVLAGFVETLQTLKLTQQEQNEYLQLMAQQAHRMENVVNDLLILSRLEDTPFPAATQWTSVAVILQECEASARALSKLLRSASQVSQQLIFKQTPANCAIAGSGHELQSAFSNLISNAIRYTPAGGTIEVEWKILPNGNGQLSVKDTGAGIAAEHIPRLTERFYRIDQSRSRDTGGSGLGLAIVKHVVQRHAASLHICSTLGEGSIFSIDIPASRVQTELD